MTKTNADGGLVAAILAWAKERPDRVKLYRLQSGLVRGRQGFMRLAVKGAPDLIGAFRPPGATVGIPLSVECKRDDRSAAKRSDTHDAQAAERFACQRVGTLCLVVATVGQLEAALDAWDVVSYPDPDRTALGAGRGNWGRARTP